MCNNSVVTKVWFIFLATTLHKTQKLHFPRHNRKTEVKTFFPLKCIRRPRKIKRKKKKIIYMKIWFYDLFNILPCLELINFSNSIKDGCWISCRNLETLILDKFHNHKVCLDCQNRASVVKGNHSRQNRWRSFRSLTSLFRLDRGTHNSRLTPKFRIWKFRWLEFKWNQ